ncbi:MAG: 50S ribosomal protein L3 [Spirochaetales bacterium]|nr:50S ribosomal protein L3 [Spirochaetales bacterium]
MLALIGKKIGMTQVFDETGLRVPVTVVHVDSNYIVYKRTKEKQGYDAVAVGGIPLKKSRITKPYAGQFTKEIPPLRVLLEIKDYEKDCEAGEVLDISLFEDVKFVDVRGVSKGKGFQGVMKRHGFHGGRKTHGSKLHREPGSTGQNSSPSRVFKGKRMAGHMGHEKCTVQNLKLVGIDKEKKVMLIKGAVPGVRDGLLIITKAKKKK